MNIECVCREICDLGECPIWEPDRKKLFWTDINKCRIWEYDPQTESCKLFWCGEQKVGGFSFTKDGGMVLCTDKGVYKLSTEDLNNPEAEPELLVDIKLTEEERFNDITSDPLGRLFAGTLEPTRKTGILYRLEKGREPAIVLEGIGCSNGMAFTMDEKTFFHTDSCLRKITAYDYDRETGEISNPRCFFQGEEKQGLPDGITIDIEDHIWVAFWGGACVRRIDPNGKIVREIKIPAKQATSVMFGGEDLSDLYITSAATGCSDEKTGKNDKDEFLGGHLYCVKTDTKGRSEWLADWR